MKPIDQCPVCRSGRIKTVKRYRFRRPAGAIDGHWDICAARKNVPGKMMSLLRRKSRPREGSRS